MNLPEKNCRVEDELGTVHNVGTHDECVKWLQDNISCTDWNEWANEMYFIIGMDGRARSIVFK